MNGIRQWYMEMYPTDELGERISSTATFEELHESIPNVYEYIDINDSLIRERIFEELAHRKGVDYENVYNKWHNGVPDNYLQKKSI